MKNAPQKLAAEDIRNVNWQPSLVTRQLRETTNRHRGIVAWLTGLPGAGKSTLARATEANLEHIGIRAVVLDGDNLRHGLCADLGFSLAERKENIRRAGEVAKLFLEQGFVVIVALISPIRSAREKVRESIPVDDFFEIYCQCSLSVCQRRDPKGHYAKALQGTIPEFTGISSPYEAPTNPSLTISTDSENVEDSANHLTEFLLKKVK